MAAVLMRSAQMKGQQKEKSTTQSVMEEGLEAGI